jgi:hypothetical protein
LCHSFFPGADATIVCSPPSVGIGVPQSGLPSAMPSRLISRPPRPDTADASIVSFEIRGSSFRASSRATDTRGSFCLAASASASWNVAHALAIWPFFA